MNRAEFRSLFSNWLNRTDLDDATANLVINRALARCQRELRIPSMEKSIRITPGPSGSITGLELPDDLLTIVNMEADGHILDAVSYPQLLQAHRTGRPKWFARDQDRLLIRPAAKSYARLVFVGEFLPLNADTDTNALLDVSPECFLFACLSYAGDLYKMAETQQWDQRYQAERDTLNGMADEVNLLSGLAHVQSAYGYDC